MFRFFSFFFFVHLALRWFSLMSVSLVPDLVIVVLCYGFLCIRQRLLRDGGFCIDVACILMRSVSVGVGD